MYNMHNSYFTFKYIFLAHWFSWNVRKNLNFFLLNLEIWWTFLHIFRNFTLEIYTVVLSVLLYETNCVNIRFTENRRRWRFLKHYFTLEWFVTMQCSHTFTRCSKQNWFVTFFLGHLHKPIVNKIGMKPNFSD